MRVLHALATFLLLTGIGFFLFNLMYQLAVSQWVFDKVKILSIEDLWISVDKSSLETIKTMAESTFPSTRVNFFFHLPAALVLLVLSAIFYLPVRLLTLIGVGKKPEEK
jgi:hypothetical protein